MQDLNTPAQTRLLEDPKTLCLETVENRLLQSIEIAIKSHRLDCDLVLALNTLAGSYLALSQNDKALRIYRISADLQVKLFGADHPNVADSLRQLSVILKEQEIS